MELSSKQVSALFLYTFVEVSIFHIINYLKRP